METVDIILGQTLAELVDTTSVRVQTVATREQWLELVADRYLWSLLPSRPRVRVSVGWPSKSALAKRRRRVGECWADTVSGDAHYEVFVSPLLECFDAVHVLLHELVHAVVGLAAGHGPEFARVAKRAGLAGKMTATVPSDLLSESIHEWMRAMPAWPGAAMSVDATNGQRKQGTRMVKVTCEACGYTCRTTRKWLDEVGPPLCPAHGQMTAE